MEPTKVNIDYSLKNIPIPTEETHTRTVIHKMEQFLQRIRWKTYYFFNPPKPDEKKAKKKTETYGFKTSKNAPQHPTLVKFEEDLTHLITNLQYTDTKTEFQKKLAKDAKKIRSSNDIHVTADKTRNVYKVNKNTYNTLMRNNVTSHYQISNNETLDRINTSAKSITDNLGISDRVEPIAPKNSYITIKDHKPDYPNNIKCRLINPAKSNIGKISKQILTKINETIRQKLGLQQWRSTTDTLNWFKNLKQKQKLKFLVLDIVDFYPSINEKLFETTLNFANTITPISDEDATILRNARKSILFHNGDVWTKNTGLFDVTMGSYDGCEICELVGLYIIHTIKLKFQNLDFGLYRDDGLGATTESTTDLERTKKELHVTFNEIGLKITCEIDLQIVNFLDVTLNLNQNRYHPYRKPNDTPVYIHKDSNHPPHVAKQLPISINKRLNHISCDKKAFDNHKAIYEKALKESGHNPVLTYQEKDNTPKPKKRIREKNAIWFTPPYNVNLKTNIGKEFLRILDKNFPINNPLHTILNRKTVKISYSCTTNMKTTMQNRNRKLLNNEQKTETPPCNCQKSRKCPTPDTSCNTTNVIYNATVKDKKAEYIGCTTTTFKERHRNHTKSFRHEKYQNETTLSTYIWQNKLNPNPDVVFKIIKECSIYTPGQKSCDLCLSEKYFIIKNLQKPNNINKRTDIGNKCTHIRNCTLDKYT